MAGVGAAGVAGWGTIGAGLPRIAGVGAASVAGWGRLKVFVTFSTVGVGGARVFPSRVGVLAVLPVLLAVVSML